MFCLAHFRRRRRDPPRACRSTDGTAAIRSDFRRAPSSASGWSRASSSVRRRCTGRSPSSRIRIRDRVPLNCRAPATSTDVALVHGGDFRIGNVMVGRKACAPSPDWELAHAGDPYIWRTSAGFACSWRFGVDHLLMAACRGARSCSTPGRARAQLGGPGRRALLECLREPALGCVRRWCRCLFLEGLRAASSWRASAGAPPRPEGAAEPE